MIQMFLQNYSEWQLAAKAVNKTNRLITCDYILVLLCSFNDLEHQH